MAKIPLIPEPEDPERRRARVAAERREAGRIEAARLSRMAERRTQRLACEARRVAHEAERDAIEKTAASLFPWEALWARQAAFTGRPPFKPPGKRPHTRLALIWAGYVIRGRYLPIGPDCPPDEFFTAFKACAPVNTDPRRIEPLIEFTARFLALNPGFDTDGFRELARTSAAEWTRRRRAILQKLEPRHGVVIEDFGGGWIAANLDVNAKLFFGGRAMNGAPADACFTVITSTRPDPTSRRARALINKARGGPGKRSIPHGR